MVFEFVNKNEVMSMLGDEDIYILKVKIRQESINEFGKYCSSRQIAAMSIRELMKEISNPNTTFIRIKEEP